MAADKSGRYRPLPRAFGTSGHAGSMILAIDGRKRPTLFAAIKECAQSHASDRYEICDIERFMESSIDQKRLNWVVRLGAVGWLAILGSALGYAWSAQRQRFDEALLRQLAADRDQDAQSVQPLQIRSESLQRSSADSPK